MAGVDNPFLISKVTGMIFTKFVHNVAEFSKQYIYLYVITVGAHRSLGLRPCSCYVYWVWYIDRTDHKNCSWIFVLFVFEGPICRELTNSVAVLSCAHINIYTSSATPKLRLRSLATKSQWDEQIYEYLLRQLVNYFMHAAESVFISHISGDVVA